MAENSKIQWTDHTFNPWRGCAKVAEGCRNCYADALSKRNPATLGKWGANGTRVVLAESGWRDPQKWNAKAQAKGERQRVFCASLADIFEPWKGPMSNSQGQQIGIEESGEDWGMMLPGGSFMKGAVQSVTRPATMDDFREEVFNLVDHTPNLDWLLVTKRPENIRKMWSKRFTCEDCGSSQGSHGTGEQCGFHCDDCGSLTSTMRRNNAWLLTSIACQADIKNNLPHLVRCRDLVPVLGLSIEPLIGPVEIGGYLQQIDWVIVGGESGPNARPCRIEWIRAIVGQCKAAGVPCFVKQLGANATEKVSGMPSPVSPDSWLGRVSDAKGGDPEEWPEDLRVRQFPDVKSLAV